MQPRPARAGRENRVGLAVPDSPVRPTVRLRRTLYNRTRTLGRTDFDAIWARNGTPDAGSSDEAWNRLHARAALDLHTGRPDTVRAERARPYSRPLRMTRTHLAHQVATVMDIAGGLRVSRSEPLTREDLWVHGVGPGDYVAKKPHEQCSICTHVKSHPVS
ncbi:hypothetical protein B0H16DRAFT_1731437 [Mycena metata]|uniref:Uncharacterized protein n=1 Tax=Mycena metata TaxID=1033252 RepID=A0AAD7I682_9AGAR|nr:hypothetical protein B0H16DRAFT_1731437 [Mycena metata]